MFIAATIAIVIAMILALIRALLGPTIYDRILAVNLFGTKALLLIAVMGFLTDRPEFLDIAMVVIEFYGYEEKVFLLQDRLSTKGGFFLWLGIMVLAGFTPLPFKVFTITSGIINFDIIVFFFICLFTRGLRFFIVAYLTSKYGYKFGEILEKKGYFWLSIVGLAVVIIIAIIYFVMN